MKTTSESFRSHLDGDVTALCTCWKITRKDGIVLHFTDADQDVTRDGEVYKSIGAYSRSAIETTSTLSVDNLEVSGMATDLALPVEDLRAGAYDHAEVLVFMTSWLQAVGGKLKLRRGFFGEVTVLPNGTFTVELRGLLQRLSHTFTDVYSATCRHDLGDSGCGIDISHPHSTIGAHIPFPILDSGFEEVGQVGMGASATWYNPVNEEELIDAGTTYSGSYAAHGATLGGRLEQIVDLSTMEEDFLSHLDEEQVTLTLNGWRQDDGDEGRLRLDFLDYDMRALRSKCGSYYVTSKLDFPETRFSGDFTFETWIKPLYGSDTTARRGGIFRHADDGDNRSERRFTMDTVPGTGGSVEGFYYYVNSDDGNYRVVTYAPFSPIEGEWAHVALVREGDTFRIYINGELSSETDWEYDHGDFIADSLASDGYAGNQHVFEGHWDEVRIWSVARTQAEINQYRFRDLASSNDLERYYPFDGDTEDYGREATGVIGSIGNLSDGITPVRVSERGLTTGAGTGFEDVGTDWVLVSLEDVSVPYHTRYVRVMFDSQSVAGTPEGSRLDSLFGWFKDNANTVLMPNFTVGANDAVWTRAGMVTTGGSNRIFRATIDEPRADNDGWFQGGLVTFYSGNNAGASMEVKRWTADSSQIELFLSLPYPVEQGDLFTIYPGCDKSRIGCVALFQNVVNFFGTPDVPGEDNLFRYADSKD